MGNNEQQSLVFDKLSVNIYANRGELGRGVAIAVASKIQELLKKQERVSIVFAAAASQNEFLDHLSTIPDIDWSRVVTFHMDEYIGLAANHPQLFANYLNERIFNRVKPGRVFLLNGQVNPIEQEIERYTELLRAYPLDLACIGIGENGHIAFNDPAFADFNDPVLVKLVEPDLTSRMQQVHDGCFKALEDVPTKAYTLTIPALVSAKWIYCTVPGPTKKQAVHRCLHGTISNACPASILRTHDHAALFLDLDSAKDVQK
jgi:glucosamine-6-phosphate deaminase